jgi:hydroxyethylthiazole kinase-like uncharacterized protein yjeF
MLPLELLTNAEMVAAERLTMQAGTPGITLMERAGAAVADLVAGFAREGARIAVLCGPGNNGGDGFIAARLLQDRGFAVALGLLGHIDQLKGDAALAAGRWGGETAVAGKLDLTDADIVIDALFGSGLSRDLDGAARALVEKLNAWSGASGRSVVAVDVPSGLDADTGSVRGAAVRATATLTFFRLRPGHLLMPGRALCGELDVADIGIDATTLASIKPQAFANQPALWRAQFPIPLVDGHKYSRGHVLVVSGGPWQTGAARLAARGALRAGAGLVTLASPRAALTINASHLTAIMLKPCDSAEELAAILADVRFNAVVMGPGLGVGAYTAELVETVLATEDAHRTIVLDADALTSFAGRAKRLASCIRSSGMPVVLTPHEGEYGRLFNAEGDFLESTSQRVDAVSKAPHAASLGKLARARRAANNAAAIMLLKGPDTVVADAAERASIGSDAPPWLATAGSGDVLAGMIAGLTAQGMPAFEAASAAVWLHAAAARAHGPGLISEDIPEALPQVLRELYG